MKLKPNGLVKILEQIPQSMTIKDAIKIEKIEFEPSDFMEVITLTVDEARAIRSKLIDLLLLTKGRYRNNVQKDIDLLCNRVEMVTTPNANKINELDAKTEDSPTTPKEVRLTVEEAGILVRCAANEFCRLIMEHAPIDSAREVEVLMYDLVKRIGQAEAT